MECEEFRTRVQLFRGGKLDAWDLDAFVDHAVECAACEACLLAMADEYGESGIGAVDAPDPSRSPEDAGVTPRRKR